MSKLDICVIIWGEGQNYTLLSILKGICEDFQGGHNGETVV